MNSSYQKLNHFQTSIGNRLTNMSGRTPSFIVVGLVIIMFLLGLFYMSCSSKNTELRLSVDQFEERIRTLTIRSSGSEKKIETINARKHELEEEKLIIQKQMEKKDSEINDLNTKFNEKKAEIESLKSDKAALDEQLKEYKSMIETLASKNSLIAKLQQQLYDQKQTGNDELTRLKQEYESLKNNRPSQNNQLPSNNEQQNNFQIPQERFRPLISNNGTTKSIALLFQNPFNKLNNLTNEVKAQIIPAALDVKDTVLNAMGMNTNSSTTIISDEQQEGDNDNKRNEQVGQNVPAPPLDNNNAQQPNRVESAQVAPQSADKQKENNQAILDNPRYQHRLQRSVNDSIADNQDENDDEDQHNIADVQETKTSSPKAFEQHNIENINHPVDAPSRSRSNNGNYRIGKRKQFRQEQQLDNGEEVENDDENNQEDQDVRKGNVV